MTHNALTAAIKPLNAMTKIILIVAIMIMSATGALMIRLKKGPLDLEFARERIAQQLSDENLTVEIGQAQLVWPEVAGPMLIELGQVRLIDKAQPVLAVSQVAMGLSGLNLLQGKIRPDHLVVIRPEIKILDELGNLNAFWENREKKVKTPQKKLSQNVPTLAEFEAWKKLQANIMQPKVEVQSKNIRNKIATVLYDLTDPESLDFEVLSALDSIQIKDAVLYGMNLKEGALAALNINLEKSPMGLKGDVTVAVPKYKGKNGFFRFDVTYRRAQKDLTFLGNVENIHTSQLKPFVKNYPTFTAQDIFLNGNLQAALNDELRLAMATVDFNVPTGEIVIADLYKKPIKLSNVILKAQLNRPEKKLNIEEISGNIGGVPLTITSQGIVEKGLITGPVSVKVPEVSMETIAQLVPASEVDTSIGQWLTRRLADGVIKDINISTNLSIKRNKETKKRDVSATNTKMTFGGEGLMITYVDTLMPVKNSTAQGVYENDTLTITSKKGQIGDIQGKDVKVVLTDLTKKGKGFATIDISAGGPLKTALKYAASEPIAATNNLSFDVNKVEGNVDFKLNLQLPTVKDLPKEQVAVLLDGTVTNLLLPNVVKGQNLTGGPYALKFGKGQVSLTGKGKLSGRDIDMSWMEYMNPKGKEYASKITAKVNADKALRDVFGIGLEDYLSGNVPVDVTYLDLGVNDKVEIKGDLSPATIKIASLNYNKPSGTAGTISLTANLKNEFLTSVDNLKIDMEGLKVSNGNLRFQQLKNGDTDLKSGELNSVSVGRNKVNVEFEYPSNRVVNMNVNGSVIDIEPFIKSNKSENIALTKSNNMSMNLRLEASKMLANSNMVFTNSKVYVKLDRDNEPNHIEMNAKIGGGDLSVRFVPQSNGRRNFKFESTDAGAALRAFGVYQNMRGGKININGAPKSNSDDLVGSAMITDFSIRKAPALAKLLGAMSLPGVENLLTNEGVVFEKLASDFEWRFRENGNLLVIEEGRTSGNSLGLTFEGINNLGTSTIDISGTIIPLASVNKVIGQIPIIGDILSGGDALIAASYKMKGPTSDPKITVNPLSVLTPGFLRKILFEDDLKAKIKKEEQK